MTEVEQLRKEVNELRERLVRLEYRVNPIGPGVQHQPIFTPSPLYPSTNPFQPPYVVTCTADKPPGVGTYSGTYTQPKPDPGQVY